MLHTGVVYLSKQRPLATQTSAGEFLLQLAVVDRISSRAVEAWRLVWQGPPASEFWQQHQGALKPGTPLRVVCESARVHSIRARPDPITEIHAHIVQADLLPSATAIKSS